MLQSFLGIDIAKKDEKILDLGGLHSAPRDVSWYGRK